MADFDINKELEVINFKDFLVSARFNCKNFDDLEIKYFYHGHRLGTRVPLFVIVNDSWPQETILYLCKIGNVLSFEYLAHGCYFEILSNLFRRYGSNYGIFIHYGVDENQKQKLLECLSGSSFLKSEFCCFVQLINEAKLLEECKDIKIIQVRRVKDIDLQNALLLEKIQNELKLPCLDWTWQYEQSDQLFLFSKLVFKNLEKWKNTESRGDRVMGTRMIPMKLMRDDDEDHSPQHVIELFPEVGLIIDLSNDEGSYNKEKFLEKNVDYKRIQIESKVIPSLTDVFEFISMVKQFSQEKPEKDIIVHCHYGYNRTGLMICSYLIENEHVTVQEAIKRFKVARPPGIKHQNYLDKLILRYSDYK